MGIALVPRGVRALAEQVNAYYRVLKAVDPDSVLLRLNPGGMFQIRHSATGAPVFTVTDAGAALVVGSEDLGDGSVTNGKLADGSVTTDKIADGTILNQDISPDAAIDASTRLADGSVTAVKITPKAVTADRMADGTITNTQVSAAAGIALNKLQHVGANQVVRSDGAQNVGGLIRDANIDAAGTANIAVNKLAHLGAGNVLRSNGSANVAGKIVAGDIATGAVTSDGILDGTIQDADISAGAAIAASKLAGGGTANRVAGTINGTAVSMMPVIGNMINPETMQDAHFAVNTINGNKLADNSIPSTKLIGGATIPANSIDSTHVVDGSLTPADMAAGGTANRVLATVDGANVAMQQVATGMLAANAATLSARATATSSSPASSSATPVVIAEMTVTLTTTGAACLLMYSGSHYGSSVGALWQCQFYVDGAPVGASRYTSIMNSSEYFSTALHEIVTPAAGARTIDVRQMISAGAVTAVSVNRAFSVVEFRR